MQSTIKTLPESSIEITGALPWETLETYKEKALTRLGKDLELPGFRKGMAPQAMIEKEIPEIMLIETMAEYAIEAIYPTLLTEHKVDVIGRPEVFFTKIGKGSVLEFRIVSAVMPTFELPDYKKIAADALKGENTATVEITESDIDNTIKELQRMRAHQAIHEEGGHAEHDHSHAPIDDATLPEINDEFAKSFGFEDVIAMRAKVKENMEKENADRAQSKKRMTVLDALTDATTIEIPNVLLNAELNAMLHRMKHDIAMMGYEFEDYLKNTAKTEEQIRTEFIPDAKKRVVSKLILEGIAKKESVKPTEEVIEKEVSALMQQYPDADRTNALMYVEEMLTNNNALTFLEEQK